MLKRFTRTEIVTFAALALTLLFVFFDQARDEGFQAGHRGSCSANVLAIIGHATPENHFVGYSMESIEPGGRHEFSYFDRYPVFFTVAMHAVLHAFDLSQATQIYVARQAMNALHALTLIAAVGLLIELEIVPGLAVAAVALAASGKLIVAYRDMIHFDQAALLGFVGLLWAIARWYRVRDDRFIYVASAVAVSMGRGYASFAVLGTWWIVEAARAVRQDVRRAPKVVALGPQTRACLLAIGIAGACLGYNMEVEAHKRGVPMAEVGIIESATRRLAMNPSFNKTRARALAWGTFTRTQAARGLSNLTPYFVRDVAPKSGPRLWLGAGVVALGTGLFIARRKPALRAPFLVASLAGFAWIFPMRGLTAFHDFTTMFLLSLGVVFASAVLSVVPPRFQLLPAVLACACLAFSTHDRNHDLRLRERYSRSYTDDLGRIAARLAPGDPVSARSPENVVPKVPYALGFLLPNQPILAQGLEGKYFVGNVHKAPVGAQNLTPENRRVALFLMPDKQVPDKEVPDDPSPDDPPADDPVPDEQP
jgi:hypothetical protein